MISKVRMNWWEFVRMTRELVTTPDVWELLMPLTRREMKYVVDRVRESGFAYLDAEDVREWINEAATT